MSDRMRRINCIHFIGIAGSGMSGIAEVLLNLGYRVQGSDLKASDVTQRLTRLGARVWIGHAAANIGEADVVVISSAVKADNVELVQAQARRLPIVQRAEMLGELMRFRYAVAVAGTHGKTTTTSMVASALAEGGLDPTFVIGGRLKSVDSNARLGSGKYLVAEADESDASFLHLQPMIAIVTNVDNDHLATHEGDFERLKQSFIEFLHNLPFYGLAVVCADDPVAAGLLPRIGRPFVTYGIEADADVRAVNIVRRGLQTRFEVQRRGADTLSIQLNLPGTHNVLNSLAAISVATELGVSDTAIQRALANFQGADRRLQQNGEVHTAAGRVTLIDDYGHHPTELAATLEAIRQGWPERRIVLAFQPHRFTRTRDLLDDFARVLAGVDALVVTEVYSAGETPITGADGKAICRAIRSHGRVEPVFLDRIEQLPQALAQIVRDGDLVVTMGAGNVGAVAADLPRSLVAAVAESGRHAMNALALPPDFDARVLRDEPMAKHTSWHVGGPADLFFRPLDVADLAAFLRSLDASVPLLWIGLGSNLLVRDGGIRGAVIETHGVFDELERLGENEVWCGAGVACAKLAKQCIRWGLGPAEFFAGIPGTLGGALAMNAGAFGGETWRHVLGVATLDRGGDRHDRNADEYEVSYRHVRGRAGEWFLGARLRFEKRPGVSNDDIRVLLARRKATQPIGEWSCGSVFTNPPGDHAARLIETAGLKGTRIGGARVSEVHANFIINDGTASAADIERLIELVMQTVQRQHGVELRTEVRIVGRRGVVKRRRWALENEQSLGAGLWALARTDAWAAYLRTRLPLVGGSSRSSSRSSSSLTDTQSPASSALPGERA